MLDNLQLCSIRKPHDSSQENFKKEKRLSRTWFRHIYILQNFSTLLSEALIEIHEWFPTNLTQTIYIEKKMRASINNI